VLREIANMSSPRVLIYLLRRDLRFADNPVFYEIAKASQLAQPPYTHLLPVYIFAAQQVEVSGFLRPDADPSPFPEARSQVGRFWRCGPHRARFLAESVWDLKTTLTAVGSGLDVRVGLAGQVIRELVAALQQQNTDVAAVWMTGEEGVEEKQEERDVKQAARDLGTEFQLWTDEKYYVDECGSTGPDLVRAER
jgi:deoxyribodipyrimidine photo-lyase